MEWNEMNLMNEMEWNGIEWNEWNEMKLSNLVWMF
jgi:hypothetical protein